MAEFQIRNGQTCIIRPAKVEDAEFIGGRCAAGLFNPGMTQMFTILANRVDTLYSYRNAIIGEIDGVPVACVVSYLGDDFNRMAIAAFGNNFRIQALPGEYHFDTVGTLDGYRCQGIATNLINYVMDQAIERNYEFTNFTLVTEPDNDTAIRLYESLGFHRTGERRCGNFIVLAKPRG